MSSKVRLRAIDPAASFLVQAPAGSGKTELLTQRILRLLAVVDAPEEILALTFTRKAAAEMRSRVVQALGMPKPEDPDSHRMHTWRLADAARVRSEELGWHLEQHPARLRVMTLDSFTHGLAAQMPLLSGFGEMPTPSSHPDPLYREAAENAVQSLLRTSPEQAAGLLLHQDHNAVALIELLAAMLARRDQWLDDVAGHTEDMKALRTALEASLVRVMSDKLTCCAELLPMDIKSEMPALLRFAGENLQDDGLRAMQAWPGSGIDDLPVWQRLADMLLTRGKPAFRKRVDAGMGFPPGKPFADQKARFADMLAMLAEGERLAEALHDLRCLPEEPRFDDAQWQVLEALLPLLLGADAGLQRIFEQRGEADFIEIALRAKRALEDESGRPSDLLLRLDYRIQHILVDEFQDTSLLQIQLLQCLTAGWQAGDGMARSLFMVGDPMQSIYRFRKAEVGLFLLAAANRAGLPEVEPLGLVRNFRSSPVIVDWVNTAFAGIFPVQNDVLRGAVCHAGAEAALQHAGEVRLCVQTRQDDAQEAVAVADAVAGQLNIPGQGGELRRIAILARSRKHLHAIMPALDEAGIAYRAIDILPLNRRPEIRQMRAMLRALLHPADSESWAALLRGPCCGLDTLQMHSLLAGDKRPVNEILGDSPGLSALDADARLRVARLMRALSPAVEMSGRVGVRRLLYSAWQLSGLPGTLEEPQRRNCEAFLALVDELDEAGSVSFRLLDERLEKLYASPDTSVEAARVELLTMHGAKGLQWDAVILPGLGRGKPASDSPLLAFTDIPGRDDAHPLLAMRPAVRRRDAVYDLIRSVEKERESNELSRLLYVACTRAESALLMFGHVSENTGMATSGSLLARLLPEGVEAGCFGAGVVMLAPDDTGTAVGRQALHRMCMTAGGIQESRPEPIPGHTPGSESVAEYFWAGPEAAPVGTALHAGLQQVAEKGIEAWQREDTDRALLMMRRMLIMHGLSGASLESALGIAQGGLERTLSSERGRWILSSSHRDAHCEWSLSAGQGAGVRVLDRCFIDDAGDAVAAPPGGEPTRWIVDYKTGSHEGGDIRAFLDAEKERYRSQLEDYARLVSARDEGCYAVRMGLYFPMLDAWMEVEGEEL